MKISRVGGGWQVTCSFTNFSHTCLTTLTNCSNDVNATVVSYALWLLILLQTACLMCEGTIHTDAYRLRVLTWIGNCLVFHVHLLSPAPKCARTLSTVLNGAYTETP